MLTKRERPRTPDDDTFDRVFATYDARMASPAPLPSLHDALQRRAAVFGPVEADEPRRAPRGLRMRLGAALRGLANLLEPARAVVS